MFLQTFGRVSLSVLFLFACTWLLPAAEPKFTFQQGDHLCLIGNTLADRMQHDGWLETYLHTRFPQLELSIRNLGFSADEINNRPRNDNFGDADKHLTHSKADVIWAFFGYNESFAGAAGVDAFKNELTKFIDHTLSQKYNGKSAPRLVLFTPIAHENLKSPHLPDGSESNARLELYAKAMLEVGAAKNITVVNLFDATKKLYASAQQPLTFNGIHMTESGNRVLADAIDTALFETPVKRSDAIIAKLRPAIQDKNIRWFNRYRVTDGYNVYGGRSGTGNYDGQTNFTISARELEIVDVQVANRDKRIWALAKGSDLPIDDSNAPKALTIKTNKPGKNPDGTHVFLSGEEAIKEMTVHSGMKVNLFADEAQFKELLNPVQSSVDADGRLWVACWPSYPHWHPNEEFSDSILILEDNDGDGKADKCKVFADKLHNPTGFEFWGGGILVGQAPDLMFLKDTDGDDVADVRLRVMHGIDSADTHHTANAFVVGTDGWLYYQSGIFQVFGIESPWHAAFRHKGTGVYRFNPLTYQSEHYFNVGPNPHGDTIDRWGNQFCTDGTTGQGYHIGFPHKAAPKQVFVKQYRPVPGIGMIQGSHFGPELQGNLLVANVIGFQGVAQYKFNNTGATFHAEPVEPILTSKDPNFRPSYVRIGGDGALYITDWQNPIIGHLQHNLRDPNRDRMHGRVYRITQDGRPVRKPVKMRGMNVDQVVEQLTSNEDDVRYRARLELTGRDHAAVLAAAVKLSEKLDPAKSEHGQALTECLWLHSTLNRPNEALLRKVLTSVEPNARAAATRVLRDWINKVANPGPLLVQLAGDSDARVRAEAVVAATYYNGPEAAEVIFIAESLPQDQQLTHNLTEARKMINVDAMLKEAVAKNLPLSNAAQVYMLRSAGPAELMKLKPSEAVFMAILSRAKVNNEQLQYAITGLAGIRKQSELQLLINLIKEEDAKAEPGPIAGAGALLLAQSAADLKSVRKELNKFAESGKQDITRRIGYAAWITADGNGEDAFLHAGHNLSTLTEVLAAVPFVKEPALRSKLYAQLKPYMVEAAPGTVNQTTAPALNQPGLRFEYYLPNPADVAIETLDKLKPKLTGIAPTVTYDLPGITDKDAFAMRFTGMLNVKKAGKHTFHLTSDDGSRLYINGQLLINHDGLHGADEKSASIDLSAGSHSLVVTYFDNGGGDALSLAWSRPGSKKKENISAEHFSNGPSSTLNDLVIAAVNAIPGREAEKFSDLAGMIRQNRGLTTAVSALRKIKEEHWDKKEIRPLIDSLVAHLSKLPASARTSPTAEEMILLTKALAKSLPAEQATAINARLENLDVRVIAIGTVLERMIYDTDRVVVEAGRPVEIRFSNADKMPHNLVLIQPGSLEEVGNLAESSAQTPDVMQRQYVPKSDKIIVASKLLQPDESQAISFEAPKTPGVYPFVCTYPGHWRRMYGMLIVVPSLSEYEANPAEYLASQKLAPQDELLKLIGKDREWKLEELSGFVTGLQNRSYEVGYRAFKTSTCIACHKIGNEGQEIGPDLTKLDDTKADPRLLLTSLLMPSQQIDEKFQQQTFILDSGKTVTGIVKSETATEVQVITNPLAKSEPVVIAKSEIEQRAKSDKSIMPEGLLSKLTREEILDLIAFLHARADKKHTVFGGHDHGKH